MNAALLSAEQVVDLIQGYENLTPLTKIVLYIGHELYQTRPYKDIGPDYIDCGDSSLTSRWPLDQQFVNVVIKFPPADEITLFFPTGTVVW